MLIQLIKELSFAIVLIFVVIPELFVFVCQVIAAPFWLLWQIVKLFRKYVLVLFLASCVTYESVPVAATGKLYIVNKKIKFERTGKEVVLPDTIIHCAIIYHKRLPKNRIQ